MNKTDKRYCQLIHDIYLHGDTIIGRNGPTKRLFAPQPVRFQTTPLVTIRKTAWKKAIREMEWFLSGDATCPPELLDWWATQLNPDGQYIEGYSHQFRSFNGTFDQISALIEGIKTHPFSRRHVITTWNPEFMGEICEINDNPNTPTPCHTSFAQFSVSSAGLLSMLSVQRSADMLLGVPHNWIQSWAFLLWLCVQTDYTPGDLTWIFGDAHIYCEESHIEVVTQMRYLLDNTVPSPLHSPRLIYNGKPGDEFKASDFEMVGKIPEPAITIRPTLL